uniref:Ig-like domain-containing protein n=1 Tax=Amphilophus citrinellus TaxID=61819 RepID=A0A3Q0R5C8_AMPCI
QFFSSVHQKNITADSGQDNVTLPCRAPNNNSIVVVKYNRTDLGSEYVALYQDGYFVPDEQHPSYETRVDLQDEDMKDGDVSVILKNVKMNDTGTYKCHVAQREPNQERAMLKLLSSITLRVVDPPVLEQTQCRISRARRQRNVCWNRVTLLDSPVGRSLRVCLCR